MVKLIIERLPTWSPAFAVFQLLLATYKIYIVWFLAKVFFLWFAQSLSVWLHAEISSVTRRSRRSCEDGTKVRDEPTLRSGPHPSWRSSRGLDGHDGLWPVTWGLWSGPYLPHGSILPAVSFSGMYFRRQNPPTTLPMGLEPQYLGILSIALLEVT